MDRVRHDILGARVWWLPGCLDDRSPVDKGFLRRLLFFDELGAIPVFFLTFCIAGEPNAFQGLQQHYGLIFPFGVRPIARVSSWLYFSIQ